MRKTKTYAAAGLALLALSACDDETIAALGGATSSAEQRADFLTAVATTDCVLIDQRQYGAVEFQAGLSREEVIGIAQYYLTIGKAQRIEEGGVLIQAGPCSA
ncbi:MAG: hypothetical protein AAGF74_18970 [Pseudomonadota bacterium]